MSVKSSTELTLYVVLTMPTLNKANLFCVVVYLPTNFEKDWPTLLPDCFAWFSHRQALNNDLIN
jgi:hypothetical protein